MVFVASLHANAIVNNIIYILYVHVYAIIINSIIMFTIQTLQLSM